MAAKAKEHPRGSGKWYVQVCKNGRTKLTKMRNRAEAEHKAKQVKHGNSNFILVRQNGRAGRI